MDLTIQFPDRVGKALRNIENKNEFIVKAVQEALDEHRDMENWREARMEGNDQKRGTDRT